MSQMDPEQFDGCIGVFDSGVGGISVLKELCSLLPGEDFVFFGDSANAPYGDKPEQTIFELSSRIARGFIESGCKAIVIACNTATSTTAGRLRAAYPQVPIVGIEPALKPAALAQRDAGSSGDILVMATEMTLRLEKFQKLLGEYGRSSNVVTVPCTGLADRIEEGNLGSPDLVQLLDRLVGRYRGEVGSVVLGCTHYVFVKPQIRKVLGSVPLYDGNAGTAMQLKHVLAGSGLLRDRSSGGRVLFYSSVDTPEEIDLYKRFFALPISG